MDKPVDALIPVICDFHGSRSFFISIPSAITLQGSSGSFIPPVIRLLGSCAGEQYSKTPDMSYLQTIRIRSLNFSFISFLLFLGPWLVESHLVLLGSENNR